MVDAVLGTTRAGGLALLDGDPSCCPGLHSRVTMRSLLALATVGAVLQPATELEDLAARAVHVET